MTVTPDTSYGELRHSVSRLLAADRRFRGREQQRRSGTLSYSHLRALFVLTQEQEATVGTLAKAAELNPASVTAMVDQLEERGLVQRRRDTQDRRQCWVSLTHAGRGTVEAMERSWQAKMTAAFADVTTEEITTATKVVEHLAAVMESLAAEELPRVERAPS